MNRRKFFILSGTTTAVLLSGGVAVHLISKSSHSFLGKLIKDKLNYLTIDPNALQSFCDDFISSKSFSMEIKTGLLELSTMILDNLDDVESFIGSARIQKLQEELTRLFLLSSDFFFNNSEEDRTIQYIKLYKPIESVCYNPFARLT